MNSLSLKPKYDKVHLVIGVPSGDQWDREFGLSLATLTAVLANSRDPEVTFHIANSKGSILPELRHNIVEGALQAQATHILWIDSDQKFPHDTFHRLYKWKKPMVGCNVATKKFPSSPTARLKDETDYGKPLFTTDKTFGLREVWRLGFGVMLCETRVFRRISPPWFQISWLPGYSRYQGEDWEFCRLCEKHDIPVYVDQGLSYEIGHAGRCVYDHKLVLGPDSQMLKEAM